VRWFGESWGAPVCEPSTKVAEPVGASCLFCPHAIMPGDSGFLLPSADMEIGKVPVEVAARHVVYAVHGQCMLAHVLGPDWRQIVEGADG
jgi:hypothetical protein